MTSSLPDSLPPPADPDHRLLLAWLPNRARGAAAALLAVDAALGGILRSTREPMIGMMRLAWWREALGALDDGPAPAHPVLRSVAAALPGRGAALAAMVDGWEVLLEPAIDPALLAKHGMLRGGTLFAELAMALNGAADDGVRQAGAGWAMADAGRNMRDVEERDAALAAASARLAVAPCRWRRPLYPLAALAALARRDAVVPDAGRGGPGRAWRIAWAMTTGRG